MKKTILILSAIIFLLGGCKKFDEIEPSKVEVRNQYIERGWDYIKISGEYEYPVALEAMKLLLSENADMRGTMSYDCILEGKSFAVETDGLKDGIVYYYQYEYDNGYVKEKGEKGNSSTISKSVVITKAAGGITTTSAVLSGELINKDTANKIEERGFCWGTTPQPTIDVEYYNNGGSNGTGTSTFSHNIGNLQNNATYYFRAYIKVNYGIIYGEEKSFTTKNKLFYDYVDLGLPSGLKWATCNVGANKPEDYGDYYAWGETETKSTYTENNCTTYGVQMNDISGNAQYDVARKKWGGTWRIPTKVEIEELVNKCTWTWTTQNGVNGYKVTGPNGNSIFLPAAGYRNGSLFHAGSGYYWSSTPYESNSYGAYRLNFNSSKLYVYYGYRDLGQSVRPVSE